MRSPYRDFLEDRCAAEYSLGEMKVASFEAIVRALNDAVVPFIVVGGIAVNTHGYGRVTFDVDLVINFEPEQIRRAFSALAAIGYVPSVPIAAEQFADPVCRQDWITSKQMTVLRFWSDAHRETPLDVFVTEPFDFQTEYRNAVLMESSPGLFTRVVQYETLLKMKSQAARSRDLADISELRLLHEGKYPDA